MTTLCFVGALMLATAVPVEEEPFHKTVFKNAHLQAFRVTLEAGQSTLLHIHRHADAAVRLSHATTTSESPGRPTGPPETAAPGRVSARENEPEPTVHAVHNVGKTRFDVIDVQVLARPDGPPSEPIAEPAAENARMRVYRWDLAPGAGSPQHTHRRPYMVVAATDVKLRMTAPDGRTTDHPVKAGDLHWVDTEVTHTLVNRGDENAVMVEFELK